MTFRRHFLGLALAAVAIAGCCAPCNRPLRTQRCRPPAPAEPEFVAYEARMGRRFGRGAELPPPADASCAEGLGDRFAAPRPKFHPVPVRPVFAGG